MLPGGIDPRKMDALMKQMGIKSENIDATRVIIETQNGKLIIDQPQVTQVTMQGQKSFQIAGAVRVEEPSNSNEDDLKIIMEKTGCTLEQATDALTKSNGDLAEAIMLLEAKE
ncbi:nascent polypeptide-associated complex protein [Candidatus Micrarchaeota archaeon]|nr:nascent polypeptide-associated complex protein [Candidatus Micrarchaeota archaeon]